jgi:hypothetical protein
MTFFQLFLFFFNLLIASVTEDIALEERQDCYCQKENQEKGLDYQQII